jgi:type IV pilus assembly protein PilM
MLPPGAVRDGEIVDADAVAAAIRELWSRYKLKGKKVVLGLANQQVVVRQVDLPYLPDAELRKSLDFQVQDYIPIAVDQAILDFYTLEVYEHESGERFSRILLVAAQRDMIGRILEAVEKAKLEPVGLDLDAFAVLRTLAPGSAIDEAEGELLIDIGHAVTNIVVHRSGTPHFVRILLMGGGQITDGLVNGLGMEHAQAEAAKAELGLQAAGDPGSEDVAGIIAERANRFVEEIRGSVDYYLAQGDAIPIRRMVVTGGGAELPMLRERLAETLRLRVDRGRPLQELSIGKLELDQDQLVEAEPFLTVAVGLAMGATQ